MVGWGDLAEWWLGEVQDDPAYGADVLPLLLDVFSAPAGPVLDVGCGDGRVMASLERDLVLGCDLSAQLLGHARRHGPVVNGRLPSLRWLQTAVASGAVVAMVLEHIEALPALFGEIARATRLGGTLSVVMNHPAYTAPGSGPIVDQSDGEVLWRWGPYFDTQAVEEPAGRAKVTFYHRPLGTILTDAAQSGWSLEFMEERALGPESISQHRALAGQEHFPRLLGLRWRRVDIRGP